MPPSAFVQLCSSSQDVAELLLRDLPLKSLAALQATCRGLRTAVPLAVWQQAVQRGYRPDRGAARNTQLRREQNLFAAIVPARFTHAEAHTAAGVVSKDQETLTALAYSR